MAIKYNDITCMCRFNKRCEVYNSPTTFKTVKIDPALIGVLFLVDKSAKLSNGMILYRISESEQLPTKLLGKWVNMEACDVVPYDDMKSDETKMYSDGSYDVEECLSVSGNNVVIYKSSDSTTPLTCGLKLGDIVFCDKKIKFSYNGIDEIRYHIVAVGEGADDSVIDSWVLANYSMKIDSIENSIQVLATVIYKNTGTITVDGVTIPAPVSARTGILNSGAVSSIPSASDLTNQTKSTTINSVVAVKDDVKAGSTTAAKPDAAKSTTTDDPSKDQQATESASAARDYASSDASDQDAKDVEAIKKAMENAKSHGIENVDSGDLYNIYGYNYAYSGSNSTWMNIPLGRMPFVHGMPFQYTGYTDRRGYTSTDSPNLFGLELESINPVKAGNVDMYGRTFAKEIVSNTPVAVIVPGTPKFLTSLKVGIFASSDSNKSVKDSWVPLWLNSSDDADFQDMINNGVGNYDYFSIEINTEDYFKYVNAACKVSAQLMGLGNVKYRGTKCTSIDWGKFNSSADQDYGIFEEIVGLDNGVSFAFDPQSSITDSISNSTGDSQLASMMNQISSKVREVEFVAGAAMATQILNTEETDYESAAPEFRTGIWGVGDRIMDMVKNTMSGMNIRFPEIWQDSSSSKSYSLDMRFVTPYANAFCEWRYVLVPYFHIFNLAAPRSSGDKDVGPNSYRSPFLIKAFSKGYFNVEMGIIENLTWKRFGDGDMIAENGVPTQIDVTVDFKDLYHTLSTAKFGDVGAGNVSIFFNNTGLMDLVGTMSGVNMNRISLTERIAMYTSASASVFGSMGSNFIRHFSDRTRNIAEKWLFGV